MLLALIALAAADCSVTTPVCAPCTAGGQNGTRCVLVGHVRPATTPAACCAACQANPECTAYTFNSGTHSCNLKDQALPNSSPGHQKGCTSGQVRPYVPAPPRPNPPPGPHPSPPAPPPPAPSGAKNYLFIVVDDLRNELGYTNHRTGLQTPNIDGLAAKGLIFDRAYIQQGVCSPSRNSFLSGRRPDTTKIWNFKNSFRTNLGSAISSLPGAFKNKGWITTGMGKVYHPGSPTADDGALSWSLDWAPYYHPKNYSGKIDGSPDNTFQDGMSTATALARLQRLAAEQKANGTAAKPFFMAVGLHKPHIPWIMPQRFLDAQIPVGKIDTALHDTPPAGYDNVSLYVCDNVCKGALPQDPLPIATQANNRRLYRAAVSWTDHNVGLLLGELDTLGLADNTAVSFLGDHGWHLGEHGMWCKQSTFDLVARVPMLFYVPWLPQSHGQRTSALVEAVDLMPTYLALAGIATTTWDFSQLEGTSMVPLLTAGNDTAVSSQEKEEKGSNGSGVAWKNATFSQYPRCNQSKTGAPPWVGPSNNACTGVVDSEFAAMGYSMRTDRYRYTLWVRWNSDLTPSWSEVVGEELYDHLGDTGFDTDGFENTNLARNTSTEGLRLRLRDALRAGYKHALPLSRP